MPRLPFHWNQPYTDHLLWLWAVRPELPKHEIAARIGVSVFTLKVKQDKLQLPRRMRGRRSFGQIKPTVIDFEDDSPIDSSREDRQENYRNQDASDRLLDRLQKYHDVLDVDTLTIKVSSQKLPRWPFQIRGAQ